MEPANETPQMARNRILFVFALFLALISVSHVVAEVKGYLDERAKEANPGRLTHTVTFYRAIFAIWVSTVLLIPAQVAFIFSRSRGGNSYWLAFWTCSYLAFLVHLYWTIGGIFHWNFYDVFHSPEGVAEDPEKVVNNPGPDLFLTAWWTLDVVLAWTISSDRKWVQLQRGAVHMLAMTMFFGATVLASKASPGVRLLGTMMAGIVMASMVLRLVVRESDPKSLLTTLYILFYRALNTLAPWYKLPITFGVANLGALREVLRAKNLHNTSDIPVTRAEGLRDVPPPKAEHLHEREEDGFYDDLDKPTMGSASVNADEPTNSSDFTKSTPGARFGRNIPLDAMGPLPGERITEPSPRLISNHLLARPEGGFTPATPLNLLAAAWIQFQTHDWFNHGTPVKGNEFKVDLPPGDNWHQNPMLIRRTRPDPTRADPTQPYPDGGPADGFKPTFANAESHWWDGSEIYGSSHEAARRLRSRDGALLPDGKLDVDE